MGSLGRAYDIVSQAKQVERVSHKETGEVQSGGGFEVDSLPRDCGHDIGLGER